MSKLDDIRSATHFTGGLLTKVRNVSANYNLPINKVQEIYLEAIESVVNKKTAKETVIKTLSRFTSPDYRDIWFQFMKLVQEYINKSGGRGKKELDELKEQVTEILEDDIRRLQMRIGGLRAKAKAVKGLDKEELLETIEKYENFIVRSSEPRAVNHFINKLKVNPDLTSFIFKE